MTATLFFCAALASIGQAVPSPDIQSAPPVQQAEKANVTETNASPVRLIFDTDMGNDVDDALALGVIHALQSRGECELLAVTLSKDNPFAVQYCALVNAFYGRPEIPLGRVRNGKTPEDGKFVRQVVERMGWKGSADSTPDDETVPDATDVLRRTLAAQRDASVLVVVVGFSTNLARLLDSPPDAHSPLLGRDLVANKVRLLSMMAGHFGADRPENFREYNVQVDVPSAAKVFNEWPTPIVISGFEIGLAIEYPAESIANDFDYVPLHPLKEAYVRYERMPYNRPTWDLTSVLYAVRPDRGYFGLSEPGTLSVDESGLAVHHTLLKGSHRYLTVTPEQIARVREALVLLASQPPQSQPRAAVP